MELTFGKPHRGYLAWSTIDSQIFSFQNAHRGFSLCSALGRRCSDRCAAEAGELHGPAFQAAAAQAALPPAEVLALRSSLKTFPGYADRRGRQHLSTSPVPHLVHQCTIGFCSNVTLSTKSHLEPCPDAVNARRKLDSRGGPGVPPRRPWHFEGEGGQVGGSGTRRVNWSR